MPGLTTLGNFLSVTVISFLLGFLGHWFTYRVENRKIDIEILRLAIDVLKSKPEESGGADMRRWSLSVLQSYSGVKFNGDSPVRKQIILSNIQDFVGNRIDIDIFICDMENTHGQQLARQYGVFLASKFGRIRVKQWTSLAEFGIDKIKGKTTIIFDPTTETEAANDMEAIAKEVAGLPPVQRLANPGEPSRWYLSAVVCE